MRTTLLAAFLLLAAFAVTGHAQDVFQEGQPITIELQNGDTLHGTLIKADQAKLIIDHPILGHLEIARASIKPAAPKPEVVPVSPWTGTFDTSLTGSQGNTANQTFRTELDVRHEDAASVDAFVLWYKRATTGATVTEAHSFTQLRHEWKFDDTKWRTFVQGSYETDQFADYNSRASLAGGAAYPMVDTATDKVTGRLGAGISHKYGETDPNVDETNYEALLGLDWAWTISDVDSFNFTTDLYPSVNPSGEFRSITRIGYNRKVDKNSPWYFKAGVDQFYDSNPGATKKTTDYNYYVGVGRAF